MAYIEGRVQSSTTGSGLGYAGIRDNFNNYGNCDVYGLFYSFYAYFPGYQITATSGGYYTKTHEITETEWNNKFMTIRLDPKPPSTTCCFTADTDIVMADGSVKTIDHVRPGDCVLGPWGVPAKVKAVETPELGDRELYSFNGGDPFVTSEHPFSTPEGWKSIDPVATELERPSAPVSALRVGDYLLCRVAGGGVLASGNLAHAFKAEPGLKPVVLRSVIGVFGHPAMKLYNLILEEGHEYFANGFLVHNKGGW